MAINLVKGQKIDLRKKTGESLLNFCVGANWGAIESSGFLGFGKNHKEVDLDLSAILVGPSGLVDHIYSPLYRPDLLAQFGLAPGKLVVSGGALRHSGDDRAGDVGGDDGLDNEVITVDLSAVSSSVTQIFFFLNNCGQEDFSQIPYAKIRMFEGTPTHVRDVFASYNVSAESKYSGRRALILGKLYRSGAGEWKFAAIGDPSPDVFVGQTIVRIMQNYINS
ncbi:MAG: TerD family protein [Opitutia bacterium]